MKAPRAPRIDERRNPEFLAEMEERARAWIPSWGLTDGEHDFGRALLEIAARFDSEVAERLDGAGEKMRRGFLDWLAVRGEAARPARMPVVFKLADTAREGVLASAPVRMQADAAGTPVVFETEKDVRIVPGQLDVVVGIDADNDAFYLPPPGLSDLKPLEPLPTQWQLKSFAAAGVISFQIDPEAGLLPDTILEAGDQQYRIVSADKDLVTIDPPLVTALPKDTLITKVTTFSAFDQKSRNQQQHVLYLGDSELLNIKTDATIRVVGAATLQEGFSWQYWGKLGDEDKVDWQDLKFGEVPEPGALVLKKPKGSVEQREIAGKKSRWLRAYRKTVPAAADPFTNDQVGITVNSDGCQDGPCPPPELPPDKTLVPPEAEAMANITPLSLATDFFPLGKEPKQFDAFYLGSKEVFSKPGAKVQLCFQMDDPTFAGLSCLHVPPLGNRFLAGVAADSFLHLLSFDPIAGVTRFPNREPVRPPSPKVGGATIDSPGIGLDINPGFRAPTWVEGGTKIFSAVTAKNAVWIWCEDTGAQANSGWESAGSIGPAESSISGLVYLSVASAVRGRLFALQGTKLYVRNLKNSNATWEEVTRSGGGPAINHAKIVPIGITGVDVGSGDLAEGLVAVDTAGVMYGVTFAGPPLKATYTALLNGVDVNVAPAAVRRNATDKRLVAVTVAAATSGQNRELLGFLSKPVTFVKDDTDSANLNSTNLVGHFLDVNLNNGELTFVTCTEIAGESTYLEAWSPFIPPSTRPKPAVVYSTKIPKDIGTAGGSPTLLEKHVVVPTRSSQVLLAPFDTNLRLIKQVKLRTAIIASTTADELQLNDNVFIPFDDAGVTKYETKVFLNVPDEVARLGGQTLYDFDVDSTDAPFYVFRSTVTILKGTTNPLHLNEITVDGADNQTQPGSTLLITTDASTQSYKVGPFDQVNKIATLDRSLDVANPANPPAQVLYLNTANAADTTSSDLRPLLRLDPAAGKTGDWDASLLDRVQLAFPNGAEPNVQVGTAFRVDATNHPILVALGQPWTTHPQYEAPVNTQEVNFIVDAAVGDWSVQLGDTLTNPELSWEYWNGTGWSLLDATDSTGHLKTTGNLIFEVPPDIAPTDWAGKTNFWIRARLVGGDYGREKVTVITKYISTGTEQTISRSTEGIRPPRVLHLYISYGVCKPVLPTFVLAEDSGTVRDQSDANRTPGALVEAFVPLALTLGRLTKPPVPQETEEPEQPCPPDCDCQTLHPNKAKPAEAVTKTTGGTRITGREIYIGLAATLSEAPVNVLLLVNEQDHTKYAPMSIEALSADRFVPIVADDATRALGESGVLSMTFAVQPTRSELFGKKDLTWLRLIPKQADENWIPTLRGAYLNAAWASATETLTRELLGSSDGAPNLTVFLARPPLLRKTLELRVKEPLGDEERNELLRLDSKSVLSVESLPGDWVLWRQVIDPDDNSETARVYALDETSGEVRFGDGRHGKIPPIGRDSIVAFSYARTEPDPTGGDSVPGNKIAPRTALNLVSPVETVESVIAADQAAGGAPPESDERVLRFGFARLRHRSRAVTPEDLEDLTLQSSPDIVQARAFVRRGYIRLVVVMRGKNPVPNAAQIRELRRLLLDAAPASLSAPNVLRIEGPKIRRLRIELQLLVENLDHAGQLSSSVKKKLAEFFDTATGGLDKNGWALGARPSEEDIALAISDATYLESIEDVKLHEITEDGKELPSLEAPGEREIVMLADDPIRIKFETAEVVV